MYVVTAGEVEDRERSAEAVARTDVKDEDHHEPAAQTQRPALGRRAHDPDEILHGA
jgi:hypothetical protein